MPAASAGAKVRSSSPLAGLTEAMVTMVPLSPCAAGSAPLLESYCDAAPAELGEEAVERERGLGAEHAGRRDLARGEQRAGDGERHAGVERPGADPPFAVRADHGFGAAPDGLATFH